LATIGESAEQKVVIAWKEKKRTYQKGNVLKVYSDFQRS
jgi:hypothetical protein